MLFFLGDNKRLFPSISQGFFGLVFFGKFLRFFFRLFQQLVEL